MSGVSFPDVVLQPDEIGRQLSRLRGSLEAGPDASIIIPVNARMDLALVHNLLSDLFQYQGHSLLEFVLVINNYAPEAPPQEIEQYRRLGANLAAVPDVRRPGEVVIISARALGARTSRSPYNLHFDADVRIPDATALVDWYIQSLSRGAGLAYSRVEFYNLPDKPATRVRLVIHHSTRWAKRSLLGIPTARGSNYAITRALFLQLYEEGRLSVDIQVGPAARLAGARSVYSGRKEHRVYTSARKQSGRWLRLFPYFLHRLYFNLKATPNSLRRTHPGARWKGFDRESEIRQSRSAPPFKGDRR